MALEWWGWHPFKIDRPRLLFWSRNEASRHANRSSFKGLRLRTSTAPKDWGRVCYKTTPLGLGRTSETPSPWFSQGWGGLRDYYWLFTIASGYVRSNSSAMNQPTCHRKTPIAKGWKMFFRARWVKVDTHDVGAPFKNCVRNWLHRVLIEVWFIPKS